MTSSPPLPVSHSGWDQHSIALSMVAWSRSWSARAIEARTMSGTSPTGPSALSTNAGSASVLSPNSDNAPPVAVGPVGAVAPPPSVGPVGVVSPPSSPPHAAATKASTATKPMILIRCMSSPPWVDGPGYPGSVWPVTFVPPSSRCPFAGSVRGLRLRAIQSSPLAKHVLHATDDPIARDQHAPDDDEAEDHELERGGQAHDPHHLVEPGQEERRGPRRQRAGQPPGERGPADDHGGDRTQEVGSPDGGVGGTEERRQQDPGHPVEDRGHRVGRDLVQVDPETGDPRRGGVGAHDLEPPARRGEPEEDDQREGDGHPDPEGPRDAEETRRGPLGEPRWDLGLDGYTCVIAEGDAGHDLTHS